MNTRNRKITKVKVEVLALAEDLPAQASLAADEELLRGKIAEVCSSDSGISEYLEERNYRRFESRCVNEIRDEVRSRVLQARRES